MYEVYRFLQIGLLLTDSVFVELVAYFDETMNSMGGISHGRLKIQ